MKPVVVFNLTEEQIDKLRPLFKKASFYKANSNRGVVFAQCTNPEDGGEFKANFIPYEKAKKLYELINDEVCDQ